MPRDDRTGSGDVAGRQIDFDENTALDFGAPPYSLHFEHISEAHMAVVPEASASMTLGVGLVLLLILGRLGRRSADRGQGDEDLTELAGQP